MTCEDHNPQKEPTDSENTYPPPNKNPQGKDYIEAQLIPQYLQAKPPSNPPPAQEKLTKNNRENTYEWA